MKDPDGSQEDEVWREILGAEATPSVPLDFVEQNLAESLFRSPELPVQPEPAVGEIWAGRFELLELAQDGAAGRFFRAQDLSRSIARQVEVRFLHPGFGADPEYLEIVREQFKKFRNFSKLASFPREELIWFYDLNISQRPAFLVQEWIHGFSLGQLLFWKQRLTAEELIQVLEPLPSLLDHLARQSFTLVEVNLSEIFLVVPLSVPITAFQQRAEESLDRFRPWQLKLNGLSLRGLAEIIREQTVPPRKRRGGRLLVSNEANLRVRTQRGVRLLGGLVYELLSGQSLDHKRGIAQFRHLPMLTDSANQILKTACIGSVPVDVWPNCTEFWQAFRFQIALGMQTSETDFEPASWETSESRLSMVSRRYRHLLVATAGVVMLLFLLCWVYQGSSQPGGDVGGELATRKAKVKTALAIRAPSAARSDGNSTSIVSGVSAEEMLLHSSKTKPWENSLRMRFVPIAGTKVFFSVWDTRVQDFRSFVKASGYQATAGMYSLGKDGWKQRGATWESPGFKQSELDPVVGVSWEDAEAFCRWLTVAEQRSGKLPAHWHYRLPTDAEWSAAVGLEDEGSGTPKEKDRRIKSDYSWGKQWPPPAGAGNYADTDYKNGLVPPSWDGIKGYRDGYARTSPVGSFPANESGLYDMSGNVWQWCEDWYDSNHKYRTVRGGSWGDNDRVCLLLAYRGFEIPTKRGDYFGFRSVIGKDPS
jgi:hypothetical protein